MPTEAEIKDAADAAAKAADEAKKAEADEAAKAGITTDAGKEALRKERDARRASEKAAKEAADELAALKAEKATADAAKTKADEAEALKRGEHEKVITTKTSENETLKAQLEAASKRLAEIDAKSKQRIEDGLKANAVDEAFLAFDPGQDAPLDQRLDWFEKAVAASTNQQRSTFQRTPIAPRPITTTREQVVEDEKKKLRENPNYQRF